MNFKILPMFGRNEEKETIDLFFKHIEATFKTRDAFNEAMEAFFAKDYEKVEEKTELVKQREKEADMARRQIADKLFQGAFLPTMRANLFKLSEMMDDVPDVMQDSTNMLIYFKGKKIPDGVYKVIKNLVLESNTSVDLLKISFDSMINRSDSFEQDAARMKLCEERSDVELRKFLKMIYSDKKIDPVAVDLLSNLGRLISNITNVVDHTCNLMSLLKILRQA